MVKNSVSAKIVCVWPSNNTDNGKVLTVSPSNGVENAEAAHSEGDNACANPTSPGVAISSIASVEFIAAPDVVETRLSNEVVEKSKVEVPGHREHVTDADLDEPVGKVAAERGVGG
jgi:hypothetical protein